MKIEEVVGPQAWSPAIEGRGVFIGAGRSKAIGREAVFIGVLDHNVELAAITAISVDEALAVIESIRKAIAAAAAVGGDGGRVAT